MFKLEVIVYRTSGAQPIVKTIETDSREELEGRAEEAADSISRFGILDDDDPKLWTMVLPPAISSISFAFSEETKEDG